MDIINVQTYKGRNIYCHRPVIKAIVETGDLHDKPTCSLEGFNEQLLRIMPGLGKHCCSTGYEGGFKERLRKGTYIAHVVEHMILEMQCVAGYDVSYGKSRIFEEPSVYSILFEYINEKYALECLLTAVEMVNEMVSGYVPDIGDVYSRLRDTAARTAIGPSMEAIYQEAKKRNIPVNWIDLTDILQLGNGKYARLLESSLTDSPSCIMVDIAGSKHLTKTILKEGGMPVPCGEIAYTLRAAIAAALQIGYPVVVKPADANQGKGVFMGISNKNELEKAFCAALKYSKAVIVEKHVQGRDYRILTVGGKMAAAAERRPPMIIGDGIHSIRQLAEKENGSLLRGTGHEKPLTRISFDEISGHVLAKAGHTVDSIPGLDEKVLLRHNGNLSTGGTARDCTDEVHPHNVALAIKAAGLLGLDVAGVDITCGDIAVPLNDCNGAIIEVNAAPGLRMHLNPTEGSPRNVAENIVEMLYPKGEPTHIPIISVTGTNGKTTVVRMIANTLELIGIKTGVACTGGVYIDGQCAAEGDRTGALSAARILRDRRVEAAVLETARGGIVKKGLGYDLADVGVVINISGDHLGSDGIKTLKELAQVKSLVVEAIRPEGYAVLNAADGMTPFLLERVKCKTLLFCIDADNPLVARHLKKGGEAVYVKEGSVFKGTGERETFVVKISNLPVTFGGISECNTENSLAAVTALFALGLPPDAIRSGLVAFKPDVICNPGRFNIFDMGEFKIMLDYGHNPAGYSAVIGTIKKMEASGYTGVIGMPGDRGDKSILNAGRICGEFFNKLYIKEDMDLRGRDAGEVADIMYNGAVNAGMDVRDIAVIYSEVKAFETAIMEAEEGELVVLFYEELKPALDVIEKCRRMIAARGGRSTALDRIAAGRESGVKAAGKRSSEAG